jgi:hypothetical protein
MNSILLYIHKMFVFTQDMGIRNWVKIILVSTTVPPFPTAKTKLGAKVLQFSFWSILLNYMPMHGKKRMPKSNNYKHRISNSCTWPSALLGRLFPSPNWPLWKFYPPKFPATLVLRTMTAHRSPLYFRTVGGQENHVQGALLIESGVVRE